MLKLKKQKFIIKGIDCPSCALIIEKCIKKIPFVGKVEMNFLKGFAIVEYNSLELTDRQILGQIKRLGYEAATQW